MRVGVVIAVAVLVGFGVGYLVRDLTRDVPSGFDADDGWGTATTDEIAAQASHSDDGVVDLDTRPLAPPSAPGGRGPALDGSGRYYDLRARVAAAYEAHSGGAPIPRDLLEHYMPNLDAWLQGAPRMAAKAAWEHERLRQRVGELDESDSFRMEIWCAARGKVAMVSQVPVPEMQAQPLDPGRSGEHGALEVFSSGRLVPVGKMFFVDRVHVRAALAGDHGDHAVLTLGTHSVRLPGAGRYRATYEGRAAIYRGSEQRVTLSSRTSGTLSVVVEGRVVPVGSANALPRPLRVTSFEGEGYLTGDPVVLQVVTGRSRSPRVHMDGTAGDAPGAPGRADVWDPSEVLHDDTEPRVRVANGGWIPPGKVFEITRVEYRAELPARRSEFIIRAGSTTIAFGKHKQDPRPAGTWTGSIRVKAGSERTVELRARRGRAEAIVYGRLVDE